MVLPTRTCSVTALLPFWDYGDLLGTLSLLNTKLQLLDAPMGPLNGVSLLLQFFGLGLAVIVLRRPKVPVEFKEKSQLMILILAVALLFFIFSL